MPTLPTDVSLVPNSVTQTILSHSWIPPSRYLVLCVYAHASAFVDIVCSLNLTSFSPLLYSHRDQQGGKLWEGDYTPVRPGFPMNSETRCQES